MSDVEYAALIYEISENIPKTNLEFLKFVYRDQLAMGNDSSERKRITTVRDLFLELEKKKLLGIDRVDLLEQIVTHEMMKMRSLLTKVEEFKVRRKVHVGSYQKQSAAYPTQQPAYLAQPQPMQYGNGYAPLQQAGPLYVAGQFGTPPPPYSERPNNLFSSAHVMQGQNPLLQQQPSYPRLNQHPPFSGGGYTYQKMPFFQATTY